jgi:RimJ/RimL family protein N-acetyltransferase
VEQRPQAVHLHQSRWRDAVTTARLLVRPPREADRDRFVEFFCNEDFMVFYPGALTEEEAWDRFDHMVAVCQAIPFGKQPVVELSSGLVEPAP